MTTSKTPSVMLKQVGASAYDAWWGETFIGSLCRIGSKWYAFPTPFEHEVFPLQRDAVAFLKERHETLG